MALEASGNKVPLGLGKQGCPILQGPMNFLLPSLAEQVGPSPQIALLC